MSCKSFNICVVLDVLDVTCPGVCICPRGMVYLDIWLFGKNVCTSYAEPKFPMVFNETFNFHENLTDLVDLRDVQKTLEEKYMRIALVQFHKKKQITLATYKSSVDKVLYPEPSRLSSNGESALLMKNEPLFPGTISPKITLVTKTSVTEQINTILYDDQHSSQISELPCRPNRMKKVHHTKSNNWQCFHKGEHRVYNDDGSTITDSESESQMYCQNAIKVKFHTILPYTYLNRTWTFWHSSFNKLCI
uniref:Spermatogenesis-associated protein 6 N-terminal domain-containing protein n=1 Tax=Sipha flava TaxID=143950 RepID=A0A2S2QB01_9HEMI